MKYSDAHGHFYTLAGAPLPGECTRAICCGTHPGDWNAVLDLANRDSRFVPSIGLHPWSIKDAPATWLANLENYLRKTPAAVGEIGLDRTRRSPSLDIQESIVRAQLTLAVEFARPISLHCIGAWGRLHSILEDAVPPAHPVLFHAFSASDEMLPSFAARQGSVFSFGVNARSSLVKAVPAERRVFESDATAEHPHRSALAAIHHAATILGQPAPSLALISDLALDRFLSRSPAA